MWTTPSGDSLFNDHPFGTFDAWSGRRPPHHSRQFWHARRMFVNRLISEMPALPLRVTIGLQDHTGPTHSETCADPQFGRSLRSNLTAVAAASGRTQQ
jgi:hypothetical protein